MRFCVKAGLSVLKSKAKIELDKWHWRSRGVRLHILRIVSRRVLEKNMSKKKVDSEIRKNILVDSKNIHVVSNSEGNPPGIIAHLYRAMPDTGLPIARCGSVVRFFLCPGSCWIC